MGMFPGSSAPTFPGSSASKCRGSSAQLPSPPTVDGVEFCSPVFQQHQSNCMLALPHLFFSSSLLVPSSYFGKLLPVDLSTNLSTNPVSSALIFIGPMTELFML